MRIPYVLVHEMYKCGNDTNTDNRKDKRKIAREKKMQLLQKYLKKKNWLDFIYSNLLYIVPRGFKKLEYNFEANIYF